MATDGKDDAVEGSWSPRRPRKAAAAPGSDAAAATSTSKDPEALASDIERTREELAETLDAIADKVSPKRVAKRTGKKVGESVRHAADTAQEALHTGAAAAVETVKDAAEAVKDKVGGDGPDPQVSSASDPVEVTGRAPTQETVALPLPGQQPVVTPAAPVGSAVPPYRPASATPSKLPVYAGAAAALAVVLLVLRRRRR